MNGPDTPLADSYLRARYGLPHDFDIESVPFNHLEIIGAGFRREVEAEQKKEAARQKELAALQPPKIVPQFIRTINHLKGDRRIVGIASTGAINSHNYALAVGGARVILPIPLLIGHDPRKCVGSVEGAEISDAGIRIFAKLDERCTADTFRRIQIGDLGGLSGAADAKTLSAPVKLHGVDHYFSWRLKEVSLCSGSAGANHECYVTSVWPPISEEQRSEIVETADTSQSDLTQIVKQLVETLRLPVRPIYSEDGKLIGAQRGDATGEASLISFDQPATASGHGNSIEARLSAVEARPATLYRGVWTADEAYEMGELVTCKGSLWGARKPTRSRPGEDDAWKLTVKRGRA